MLHKIKRGRKAPFFCLINYKELLIEKLLISLVRGLSPFIAFIDTGLISPVWGIVNVIDRKLDSPPSMTRKREFDTDDVLNKAMHLFWGRGYKSTSLDDLLETMEISKSSFYETFGNKHDLFLATIDEYIRCTTKPMIDLLLVEGPFIETLNNIFDNIIELSLSNRSGCMLANSAIEMSPHDKEVDKMIASAIKRVEDAWYKAIQLAQKKGEIPADKKPRALARFIVGSINGLMVISKANPHRPTLLDIKDTAISAVT